jgi:hypothetical protein
MRTYAPLDTRLRRSRSDAGPQDRPPRAPGLDSRCGPAVHGVAETWWRTTGGVPTVPLRSCAWAGCGASQAQALAAGESATFVSDSRHLSERSAAQRVMPRRRGLARRKGFGSDCEAGATNAVAIAPQPAHAQLCREVYEQPRHREVRRTRKNGCLRTCGTAHWEGRFPQRLSTGLHGRKRLRPTGCRSAPREPKRWSYGASSGSPAHR